MWVLPFPAGWRLSWLTDWLTDDWNRAARRTYGYQRESFPASHKTVTHSLNQPRQLLCWFDKKHVFRFRFYTSYTDGFTIRLLHVMIGLGAWHSLTIDLIPVRWLMVRLPRGFIYFIYFEFCTTWHFIIFQNFLSKQMIAMTSGWFSIFSSIPGTKIIAIFGRRSKNNTSKMNPLSWHFYVAI